MILYTIYAYLFLIFPCCYAPGAYLFLEVVFFLLFGLGTIYQYKITKFYIKYKTSEKLDGWWYIVLYLVLLSIPTLILLRDVMWSGYPVRFLDGTDRILAVIPFFLGIAWASLKNKFYVICALFSLLGYVISFPALIIIFFGMFYEYSLFQILYKKLYIAKYQSIRVIFLMSLIFLVPIFMWNSLSLKYYFLSHFPEFLRWYLSVTLLPFLIALGTFLFNLHLRSRQFKDSREGVK